MAGQRLAHTLAYCLHCASIVTAMMCKFGNFLISERFRQSSFINRRYTAARCIFRCLNCCFSCALFVSRCHFHNIVLLLYNVLVQQTTCIVLVCTLLSISSSNSIHTHTRTVLQSYSIIVIVTIHCTHSIWLVEKTGNLTRNDSRLIKQYSIYLPPEWRPIHEWWHPWTMVLMPADSK